MIDPARILAVLLLCCGAAFALDPVKVEVDGVVSFTVEPAAPTMKLQFNPGRWGMYDVEAIVKGEGELKAAIGGKTFTAAAKNTDFAPVKIGRVYFESDGNKTLQIDAPAGVLIKSAALRPAPEGKPITQEADRSITLGARDSTVHGVGLRYEFRPEKNTLGYWGRESDWVSWDFEVKQPGKFIVYALQGSPGGGSDVQVAVGEQKVSFTVEDTGSYHTFAFHKVGTIVLDKAGPATLELKPTKKVGGAVMDLRQVILLPVLP
jgi:hypothetical protein